MDAVLLIAPTLEQEVEMYRVALVAVLRIIAPHAARFSDDERDAIVDACALLGAEGTERALDAIEPERSK
jgi:hypothetical protein